MNKINKILFTFLTLSVVFVGCNKDDYTGHSNVNFVAPTATYMSSTGSNDITIDESSISSDDGLTITIEATLSEAVSFDTYIDLTKTGGTADATDYEISRIRIPASSTTGTGSITFLKGGALEGVETLELTANTASANIKGSEVFSFTIENDYVNNIISFDMDWSGSITYTTPEGAEATIDLCDIDFDLLVFDDTFNDTGLHDAASGSCPEHIDIEGLADGTYYIVIDLWANDFSVLGLGEALPVNFTYNQEFFTSGDFVYNGYTLDDSSGTNIVATLIIDNGYNITVTPQ